MFFLILLLSSMNKVIGVGVVQSGMGSFLLLLYLLDKRELLNAFVIGGKTLGIETKVYSL